MEPIAYGSLGLTPGTFAALTPREFEAMAEAVADRRNEDREFLASMFLPVLQALTRKPRTLASLLGGAYTVWRLRRDERRRARADALKPPGEA